METDAPAAFALALESAGFTGATLRSAAPPDAHFGNAQAIFRVGSLLLRFTRDRGQDFLDIAACVEPAHFHQFDDVAIAMGWTTIDRVNSKAEPEALAEVLAKLKKRFVDLEKAFAADQEPATRQKFEQAARLRREAMIRRLRR